MTVIEYHNHFARLRQPQSILRERHLSIGSSNAKLNMATNFITDSNSDHSTSLNASTSTVSAQLKAKIKQMRNGIPTGSVTGANIRMLNSPNGPTLGNLNNSANNENNKLTLLEVEFNVCFFKIYFIDFFNRICRLHWNEAAPQNGHINQKIWVEIVLSMQCHSTQIELFYCL